MRLLIFVMVLSGCAAAIKVGPAGPDPTPTIVGEGDAPGSTIIVYRRSEAGFIGTVASTPAITVNGQGVGTCRFDRPLVLRLPDGVHTLTALTENGQVSQAVSLAEVFAPEPSLVPVDDGTARRELNL